MREVYICLNCGHADKLDLNDERVCSECKSRQLVVMWKLENDIIRETERGSKKDK